MLPGPSGPEARCCAVGLLLHLVGRVERLGPERNRAESSIPGIVERVIRVSRGPGEGEGTLGRLAAGAEAPIGGTGVRRERPSVPVRASDVVAGVLPSTKDRE